MLALLLLALALTLPILALALTLLIMALALTLLNMALAIPHLGSSRILDDNPPKPTLSQPGDSQKVAASRFELRTRGSVCMMCKNTTGIWSNS